MINMLSLGAFTIMLATGQVLFKQIGLSIRGMPASVALLTVMREPLLYVSLLFYGAATLLWIWILSRVPLSQAYPWVAVTVLVVTLLGWWLYSERPSPIFWLGLGFVLVGVVLTQYGSIQS